MSTKSSDSHDLKLGPGWTSLSKNTSQHLPSTQSNVSSSIQSTTPAAPRIAYTKAELLELYEPESTATIPPTMSEHPGLTSSEPLVPVNIAPDDHISHVSALADTSEPPPQRTRFQNSAAAPRPGTEAILGRDHPQANASNASASEGSTATNSAAPKKPGHASTSSRDFWSGSATLAAAERPSATGPSSERRPLPLKPRSSANVDRAASPNGHPPEKSSQSSQPYWGRSSSRGAADTNSNWRGGIASGGVKYPGSSNDDHSSGASTSIATGAQNAPPRKSNPELLASSHFGNSGRSFPREGGLFSRNNKEALKPTNTRDLSALTKGSNRETSGNSAYHDREHREPRHYNAGENSSKMQQDMMSENQRLWYYRDPQGTIQGPFTAAQLIQWEKEGYYDSELPVSKSRDQGFKPLAIAFGMRKEEPPVAAPPPGFNNASPVKKEASESSSAISTRAPREERGRRNNRSTQDLAEEVERMRLEARNQRIAQKQSTAEKEKDTEKSFFDVDEPPARNENGHTLDGPLEQKPAEAENALEHESAPELERNDAADIPGIASINGSEVLKAETPVKVSRFAAFMRQEAPMDELDRVTHVAGSGLNKDGELVSDLPQSSKIGASSSAPFSSSSDLPRFEEDIIEKKAPSVPVSTAESSTAWNAVMLGLKQQSSSTHLPTSSLQQQTVPQSSQQQQHNHGPPTIAPLPPTTSEQDLMAIDPAIAHASFAKPSVLGSSPASSPRANSSDISSWLPFTGSMETNNILSHQDPLLHSSQSLQPQVGLQGSIASHLAPQEQVHLHAQAQARAQAEARARAAEAYRQAQVQAQVQAQQRQLQVQSQVQQVQAARVAAQHASAMAQAQAQAQNPAQDSVWVLNQRLGQLQVQYDTHYRAHVELTRTSRAAQAAITSAPAGTHEHQRARAVLAQATTVLKEHAFQMERIRVAANTTHAHLMQHQAAAAREQQQQQLQGPVQAPLQPSETHTNASPPSINRSETQSPPQGELDGSAIAVSSTLVAMSEPLNSREDPASSGALEFVEEKDESAKRNMENTYDPITSSEGWEVVGRKGKEATEKARDVAVEHTINRIGSEDAYVQDMNNDNNAVGAALHTSANGKVKHEDEHAMPHVGRLVAEEPHPDSQVARSMQDVAPTIAPWSKSVPSTVTGNGLSLREIQREEELRNKAEEREAAAQQEKEETAMKTSNSKWNQNNHPWGAVAGQGKPQTLSLREIEEEQKKKKASALVREPPVPASVPAPARSLGMKTGWASIAAKNSNVPARRTATATVVGKKMDDEASFWDSVGSHNHTPANSAQRNARPAYARPLQANTNQTAQLSANNRGAAVKPAPTPAPSLRRAQVNNKGGKVDGRESSTPEEAVVIGGRVSHEFANWFSENMQKLTGDKSGDTMLCEYLVTIPSASEIKDTILQNLGANDNTRSFADEFVRRLEFERTSVVADANAGGPGGRKKGRRNRGAKVDPSLVLGFTSTSSRIMQGTIETPEMK